MPAVVIEKVVDELARPWRKSSHNRAKSEVVFRIVDAQTGDPMLVGLFAQEADATAYAVSRRWPVREELEADAV